MARCSDMAISMVGTQQYHRCLGSWVVLPTMRAVVGSLHWGRAPLKLPGRDKPGQRSPPDTATRALMGTDSGCSGRVASWWISPTRSLGPSPSPMMPPAHTLMPALRTLCSVSRRSCSHRAGCEWQACTTEWEAHRLVRWHHSEATRMQTAVLKRVQVVLPGGTGGRKSVDSGWSRWTVPIRDPN